MASVCDLLLFFVIHPDQQQRADKGEDGHGHADGDIGNKLIAVIQVHQWRQQHRQPVGIRFNRQQGEHHAAQRRAVQHHTNCPHTGLHDDTEQRRFRNAQQLGHGCRDPGGLKRHVFRLQEIARHTAALAKPYIAQTVISGLKPVPAISEVSIIMNI